MKKSTIVAAAVILAVAVGLILGLHRYKLRLIHTIVENAVVQKAPSSYSQNVIKLVFDENYRKAVRLGREDLYLDRLLQASQRLEKIQRLRSKQVDDLLRDLDAGKVPAEQPRTPPRR